MLVAYEEAALAARTAETMRQPVLTTGNNGDPKEQDEGYNSHPGRRRRSSSSSSSIHGSKLNDSEKHIQALERKLARVKNKRQHRTNSVGTSPLAAALPLGSPGPSNSDDCDDVVGARSDSDVEQDNTAQEMVDDSETACLLYPTNNGSSGKRKQRERRRRPSIEDVLEAERGRRRNSDAINDRSLVYQREAEYTPTYTTPSSSNKITFSGQVRICGGIRSNNADDKSRSSERRASIYQTAPHLYGTSPSSSSTYHSPTPPRRASLSRPASFRSEISRASTPASLYAPLLLPSKTAPSPSRTLYLTFAREQGRVLNSAYKDMVKKQQQKYEDRKKRSRKSKGIGAGWFACLPGLFNCEGDALEEEEQEDEEDALIRQQYKTEMQVLFGSRPWRYFKSSYWAYRIRGLCSPEMGLDDDDLV